MKSAVLEKLRANQRLFEQNGVTYIGLFGSQARGDVTRGSDIDLLFDYDKPISLFDIASLKISLEKSLKQEVDLVSRRALKPGFKEYIERDLQIVYER